MTKLTRTKCLECNKIVEPTHAGELTVCLCGNVQVIGDAFRVINGNYESIAFWSGKDDDHEPEKDDQVKEQSEVKSALQDQPEARSREDLIGEFKRLVEADAMLPFPAHTQPVSSSDLLRYMVVILDILKRGD